MKRLAIIIRKSHDEAEFESTLASVLANRPAESSVIVICPGGYDDPYSLADEVTFAEVPLDSAGTAWLRTGLELATDWDIVHLLSAGLTVSEGWTEDALLQFEDATVAAVAPLVVRADGRIAAAGIGTTTTGGIKSIGTGAKVGSRRRFEPCGPSMSAAFFRRSALADASSLDPIFEPWLAELDLAATLRSSGLRTVVSKSIPIEGNVDVTSMCTPFKESQLKERLYWKHKTGMASIFWHPFSILTETVATIHNGQFLRRAAGRLCGMLLAPLDSMRRRPGGERQFDVEPPIDHTPPMQAFCEDRHAKRSAA